MSNLPTNLDEQLEAWGIKHLGGKFMFEPMWIRAKEELGQAITTIIEQSEKRARILGQLEMVRSANCIFQADEPAIDEIWFDLVQDSDILPMRQDTMTSYLKQELDHISALDGDK